MLLFVYTCASYNGYSAGYAFYVRAMLQARQVT